MRPDDNWRETRAYASDVSSLDDKVDTKDVERIFNEVEDVIVHRFIELLNDMEDCQGTDVQIELPYLGSLVISFDDSGKMSYNFVVRQVLSKKLKSAYTSRESPLTEKYAKLLSDKFIKNLESEG